MGFECECGEKFKDTDDDQVHKAHLVPAQEWDLFWRAIDVALAKPPITTKEMEATQLRLRETLHTVPTCQCGRCGRLYIQDFHGKLRLFLPMSPSTPHDILKKRV